MTPHSSHSPSRERLHDLLADQATQGLPVGEQAELDLLRKRFPEVDDTALELIAAELSLVLDPPAGETLPRDLREQIEVQLQTLQAVQTQPAPSRRRATPPRNGPSPFLSPLFVWGGWVAAAACFSGLVFSGWNGSPPSARQVMASLQSRTDVLRVKGQPPRADANPDFWVEVIWCPYGHYGCLRLHGLPVNDPTKFQYQLWIYDSKRDPRYPIDGGVFDVLDNGEAIVHVRAKLRIHEPIKFAVTRERAGGAVVSDGELLLLAEMKR